MTPHEQNATRLATRLAFLIAGFGIACWAPLIPLVKQRLMLNDGMLGLLLLCLGSGSITAMILTGAVNARYGSRPVIIAGCFGMVVILPMLPVADTALALAVLLFALGGFLGSLDVAMNIHAVEVERTSGRSLMSGFHALYSLGGIIGAGLMTLLLSVQLQAATSILLAALLMLVATAVMSPRLLRDEHVQTGPVSIMPRGIVWLLALLAAITFLAEGAVLDWSALLLTSKGLVSAARGGLGYVLFSVSMTTGRFLGDYVVRIVGDRLILFWGSLLGAAGFAMVASGPVAAVALAGFVLVGAGASNIVPVLFRRAGAQAAMPAGLAISAMSTCGYAGILIGPAAVGYVAKLTGLPVAFWILAALFSVVMLTARRITT